MSNNKLKIVLSTVATGVIVAGGIATYMYLKGGPSGTISDAVGSAKMVPDEAMFATYVSTDPQTWTKLKEFGTPEVQEMVEKGVKDFDKSFLTGNMSYEKDVKPWLGGVMIAVLPKDATQKATEVRGGKSSQNKTLMVIGIKDKLAALDFSNKLKSESKGKVKEIDYKGEKIIESVTKKGNTNYSSLINDRLIFAEDKLTVQQAIDTYKGEPSLISQKGVKDLFQQNVNLENTLVQVYLPNHSNNLLKLSAANNQNLPPATLKQIEQLKLVKGMAFGIGVDDAGIRMKAIVSVDTKYKGFQNENTPSEVIKTLPVNTIASINGKGIKQIWKTFLEISQEDPQVVKSIEELRKQTKTLNLDLDKDIFSWMDGEFSIAAVPGNQGILANTGFGGAIIIDTSDRKTTEATLTKLNGIAQKQASFTVGKTQINGKEVTQWSVPGQGNLINHGWLDNDTVFLAVGDPVAKSIISPPKSLKDSSNFQAIAGSLSQPNAGYLYMDMDQTMKIVNRFTPVDNLPKESKAIISSIRGLAVTVRNSNQTTYETELLLALRRNTTAKK